MFNIVETDKTTIYVIGDIHGEFKAIGNWIKTNNLRDCALIFCGDFGLGFDGLQKEHDDLTRAQRLCEERNVYCYMIRGNHDNPEYYNNATKNLNLSRFKPLSDYTVIKSPEHNILCLGGAVSTDRSYRIDCYNTSITKYMIKHRCSEQKARENVKLYWWEDEAFVYNEDVLNEIINTIPNIDVICSHSAPDFCFPETSGRVEYWCEQDPTLKDDLIHERQMLTNVIEFLKINNITPKNWFYGHYHQHHSEDINGTRYTLLNMGREGKTSTYPGGYFDMIELI